MGKERFCGWFLDAYPVREGMAVWLIADDGRRLCAVERWRPVAYIKGSKSEVVRVRDWIAAQGVEAGLERAKKRDLMTGQEMDVFALSVGDAERFPLLLAKARRRFPAPEYFNADIPADRHWFLATGRFPLARVRAEIVYGETPASEARGRPAWLAALECTDSVWDVDYDLPPFSIMGLRLAGSSLNPTHDPWGTVRRGGLEVHIGKEVRTLDGGDPEDVIARLNGLLKEHDPDIIATEYGDSFLLPLLGRLSDQHGIKLALNRDPGREPKSTPAISYFSYGRVMHRDECWYLYGRVHLDQRNSFALDQTGFDGLFENARLSRLPLQTASRTTTGTGISCMQVAQALADGILVPVEKKVTEDFKTADELLVADKGGLVFMPSPGVHERVGELDFASMYPAIMVKHNLSPETVGCACCRADGEEVPETGVRVCRRRKGLVPRVLAPLLAKRAKYKLLAKSAPSEGARARAKARAAAHKWLLVCSFGYLGYKNARFGRIEAHEATTAWGREALLLAKEAAEDAGFRVLHAIVDSLWVVRDGKDVAVEEFSELANAIEVAAGLPISFEGKYRWLAFLPSTAAPDRGVAQRYVGAFESGELKIRGVAARRRDTPPFVAALQNELLAELAHAGNIAEARVIAAGLVDRVKEAIREIESGRLRPADLVIRRNLTRAPEEYVRPSPSAVAAQQLLSRGAKLAAGEGIGYVLGEDRPYALAVLPDGEAYDSGKYAELVRKAASEVLAPFGVVLDNPIARRGRTTPPVDDRQLWLIPAG
jgi:DNA polymerase-2